ncbi:MAG TPA: hypothetical protein VKN35_00160 [Xanthomonadales bacterium]|nr:hypothetical protein [Xanthomonadales bacterium]
MRSIISWPIEWEDGSLDGPSFLIIPDELPVTAGSAANQWATLSFRLTDSGEDVVCRYRGTGETALDESDTYQLRFCVGSGRTLTGGQEVEVGQINLHLSGGSPVGYTQVSLEALIGRTVSDFYVLVVENSLDELVFSSYGFIDPEQGDFVVESLD